MERWRDAPFEAVHAAMLDIARSIREDATPGKILLVEHQPVFTAGRATPAADLGVAVVPIERGGQITYHGPGQLVVYPIVPLPDHDARAWLRALEEFGIGICAELGLPATASDDGTGVFVHGQKVGSIGVALRRWINLHGIALNIDMDLEPFHQVQPCGLDPNIMSDLSRMSGRRIAWTEAADAAAKLVARLGCDRQG